MHCAIQWCHYGQHFEPALAFDFILNPLRGLLLTENLPLPRLLQWLQVLEVRYYDEYQNAGLIDWQSDFSITVELCSFKSEMEPKELARELTFRDQCQFRRLNAQTILTHDHELKSMNITWNRRAREAEVLVVRSLEYIGRLIQVF